MTSVRDRGAGDRLAARMEQLGPLCVGIDPHPQLLRDWGLTTDAEGVRRFSQICVEELDGVAAALKPQVAFYEQYGPAGYQALAETLAACRTGDHFTIVDAKRGDIGSTMAGYAAGYLVPGAPWEADALTVSPYLGFGALQPAIDCALDNGKALFVLVLTSNPEGASVQHASNGHGCVAGEILHAAQRVNDAAIAAGAQVGPIGSVVGATVGDAPHSLGLDLAGFNGIHLAPGVGAQGAGARECAEVFGQARTLASASRAILRAGPGQLAAAARQLADELNAAH